MRAPLSVPPAPCAPCRPNLESRARYLRPARLRYCRRAGRAYFCARLPRLATAPPLANKLDLSGHRRTLSPSARAPTCALRLALRLRPLGRYARLAGGGMSTSLARARLRSFALVRALEHPPREGGRGLSWPSMRGGGNALTQFW